jgi:hypothetical protein
MIWRKVEASLRVKPACLDKLKAAQGDGPSRGQIANGGDIAFFDKAAMLGQYGRHGKRVAGIFMTDTSKGSSP